MEWNERARKIISFRKQRNNPKHQRSDIRGVLCSFFLSFFFLFLSFVLCEKKKKDKDDLLLLLFLHEYKTISALLSSIKCLSLSAVCTETKEKRGRQSSG